MTLPVLTDATFTLEERIATVTFNRDDVRNALTGTTLIDDLLAVAEWSKTTKDCSVIILTGNGSAFSAGGNIKDMKERGRDFAGDVSEVERRYRNGIQQIPLALKDIEIPMIAAINGPAVGAGFDLCNMCDIRIASTKAKFGETFVNLGIIPGDGGAWFMQRLIGYQRAAELTFTGRVFGADEAKEYGIVLDVVEPDDLLPHATKLARDIASKPPEALVRGKRLMQLAQRMDLKDFLDVCAVFQGVQHNLPEHMEAVDAMLEKMKR